MMLIDMSNSVFTFCFIFLSQFSNFYSSSVYLYLSQSLSLSLLLFLSVFISFSVGKKAHLSISTSDCIFFPQHYSLYFCVNTEVSTTHINSWLKNLFRKLKKVHYMKYMEGLVGALAVQSENGEWLKVEMVRREMKEAKARNRKKEN